MTRRATVEGIGAIGGGVERDEHLPCTIAVIVMPWHARLIDGQLLEVRTTVSVDLGVKIREQASLEQRIVRKINTPYDMCWLILITSVSTAKSNQPA